MIREKGKGKTAKGRGNTAKGKGNTVTAPTFYLKSTYSSIRRILRPSIKANSAVCCSQYWRGTDMLISNSASLSIAALAVLVRTVITQSIALGNRSEPILERQFLHMQKGIRKS